MAYKFDGWYTDHTYADKINAIDNEQIGENGRIFYGRYVPKYKSPLFIRAQIVRRPAIGMVGIPITRFRFPRGRRVCQTGRIPTLRAGITSTVRRCKQYGFRKKQIRFSRRMDGRQRKFPEYDVLCGLLHGDENTTATVNSSIAGHTVPQKGKTENLFGGPGRDWRNPLCHGRIQSDAYGE